MSPDHIDTASEATTAEAIRKEEEVLEERIRRVIFDGQHTAMGTPPRVRIRDAGIRWDGGEEDRAIHLSVVTSASYVESLRALVAAVGAVTMLLELGGEE